MFETFYSSLGSEQEQTFDAVLQNLQNSPLSTKMANPLSIEFLHEQIAQFEDRFTWNELSYKLIIHEESEN